MRVWRFVPVVFALILGGCAAKAQVRTDVEVPLLDPPPPPPRMVVTYPEPEPLPVTPTVETTATPARPAPRPQRSEPPRPEPTDAATPEPVATVTRPPAPTLTLTPSPGSEAQTVTAIRSLMDRAQRDLQRVNPNSLSHDGRTQLETARRFLQQADEALKVRNIVFAGRLADKAATMAAILVR